LNFQEILNNLIALIKQLLTPNRVLRLDISKSCELIEMSSKSISGMFNSLVSSANKTSSFNHIVPTIKCWGWKIFINRVKFKIFKWIYWSWTMLPNISNNIIEITNFEVIYWIWRKPILHINISSFTIRPFKLILFKKISHCIILVFCWQS